MNVLLLIVTSLFSIQGTSADTSDPSNWSLIFKRSIPWTQSEVGHWGRLWRDSGSQRMAKAVASPNSPTLGGVAVIEAMFNDDDATDIMEDILIPTKSEVHRRKSREAIRGMKAARSRAMASRGSMDIIPSIYNRHLPVMSSAPPPVRLNILSSSQSNTVIPNSVRPASIILTEKHTAPAKHLPHSETHKSNSNSKNNSPAVVESIQTRFLDYDFEIKSKSSTSIKSKGSNNKGSLASRSHNTHTENIHKRDNINDNSLRARQGNFGTISHGKGLLARSGFHMGRNGPISGMSSLL